MGVCFFSLYSPFGHLITDDLNVIENDQLRMPVFYGLQFRKPLRFNWKLHLKTIMDTVEDDARSWIKREDDKEPEIKSLSDWICTIPSLVRSRIDNLKKCVNKRPKVRIQGAWGTWMPFLTTWKIYYRLFGRSFKEHCTCL